MSKFIDINGETFKVIKPRSNKPTLSNPHSMRSLWDVYKNPSETKVAIYKKWCQWFRSDARLSELGVVSYNKFSFTLGCVFEDPDTGVAGYIAITPANNTLYIV